MILDVEAILDELGIEVLKETDDELWALCPGHLARTGHEDNHPSWSINTENYLHSCFSCGYAGNLSTLYSDVLGTVPEDLDWELRKASLQSSLAKVDAPVEDGPPINEWQLQHFDPVPQALLELRYLTRDAVDAFHVRWDKERRMWVLPIRTSEGELVGYQFRQKGVFLNFPTGLDKSHHLFGVSHQLEHDAMSIWESPLDAVRMYGLGFPSCSTMGAWPSELQAQTLTRHFKFIINGLDRDAAGQQGSDRLANLAHGKGSVLLRFNFKGLPGKDPGDCEDNRLLIEAWNRTMRLGL